MWEIPHEVRPLDTLKFEWYILGGTSCGIILMRYLPFDTLNFLTLAYVLNW